MIFDLGVGWPSKELKNGHKYDIDCVQFSANEKLVASFSFKDKLVVIWKVRQLIRSSPSHGNSFRHF
jgi:WD40 repeat protein